MDNKVRLKDIAKASNVSVSTASRALRGSTRVSKATRNRCLAEATRQNYIPEKTNSKSDIGVNIKQGAFTPTQTKNIAIVQRGKAHLFFTESLMEMAYIAPGLGFTTTAISISDKATLTDCLDKALTVQPAAIVLITWQDITELGANEIDKCPVPVIMVNRHYYGSGNAVTLDDYSAGVEIARRFYNLGHRRIAHLLGPQNCTAIRERADGMRSELLRLGCYDSQLLCQVDAKSMMESISCFIQQLFSMSEPPTAIWAYNDVAATIALTAVHATMHSVPGDVSIAGFNYTEQARVLNLCTFDFRFSEIGRQVMYLANQLVTRPETSPIRICIVPTFIEGCTIGPGPNYKQH